MNSTAGQENKKNTAVCASLKINVNNHLPSLYKFTAPHGDVPISFQHQTPTELTYRNTANSDNDMPRTPPSANHTTRQPLNAATPIALQSDTATIATKTNTSLWPSPKFQEGKKIGGREEEVIRERHSIRN